MRRSGFTIRLIRSPRTTADIDGNSRTQVTFDNQQPEAICEGEGMNLFFQVVGGERGREKKRNEKSHGREKGV